MDLRTERTRELLRGAILDLLESKSIDRCTITELCERAGVSRKAFYSHYETIESLAQDTFLCMCVYSGENGKRLADYDEKIDAAFEVMNERARQMFFLRKHPNLARAIVNGVGVSPYYADIERDFDILNEEHLRTMYGACDLPFCSVHDAAHYMSMGSFGGIREWVANGMTGSVERLVKTMCYFSFQVAAGVVGRPIEPMYLQAVTEWCLAEEQ